MQCFTVLATVTDCVRFRLSLLAVMTAIVIPTIGSGQHTGEENSVQKTKEEAKYEAYLFRKRTAPDLHIGPLGLATRAVSRFGKFGTQKYVSDEKGMPHETKQWFVDSEDEPFFNFLSVPSPPEPGSPAAGHLKVGDMILAIDGVPLQASPTIPGNLRPDVYRALQMHVGMLLDKAEGRGSISMSVLSFSDLTRFMETLDKPADLWTSKVTALVPAAPTGQGLEIKLDAGEEVLRLGSSRTKSYKMGENKRITEESRTIFTDSVFVLADGATVPLSWNRLKPFYVKDRSGVLIGGSEKVATFDFGPKSYVVGNANLIAIGDGTVDYFIPKGAVAFRTNVRHTWLGERTISDVKQRAVIRTRPLEHPVLQDVLAKARKVRFDIPKMGTFAGVPVFGSAKADRIVCFYADYLQQIQREDGSFPGSGRIKVPTLDTSMGGLGMLAADDAKYDPAIRKAAHFVADNVKPDAVGGWSSVIATEALFLAEYYLCTKDQTIFKALQGAAKRVEGMVGYDGATGHQAGYPGYSLARGMNIGTSHAAATLSVLQLTPVKTDPRIRRSVLEYIAARSPSGSLPYGRVTQESKEHYLKRRRDLGSAARTCGAIVGTIIGGGIQEYYDNSIRLLENSIGGSDLAHAAPSMGHLWSNLAYNLTNSQWYETNLDSMAWNTVLTRSWRGPVIRSEYYQNTDVGEGNLAIYRMATEIILLQAGKRSLALTGKFTDRHPRMVNGQVVPNHQYMRYRSCLDHWNIAAAILGDQCPTSLKAGIKKLATLPVGRLPDRLNDIVAVSATPIARDVSRLQGIDRQRKGHAIELVMGVDLHVNVAAGMERQGKRMVPVKKTQLLVGVNSRFDGQYRTFAGSVSTGQGDTLREADLGRIQLLDTKDVAQIYPVLGHTVGDKLVLDPPVDEPLVVRLDYTINGVPVSYERTVPREVTGARVGVPRHFDRRRIPIQAALLRGKKAEVMIRLDNGHLLAGFLRGPEQGCITGKWKRGVLQPPLVPATPGDRVSFDYCTYGFNCAVYCKFNKVADGPADFKLKDGELFWRNHSMLRNKPSE